MTQTTQEDINAHLVRSDSQKTSDKLKQIIANIQPKLGTTFIGGQGLMNHKSRTRKPAMIGPFPINQSGVMDGNFSGITDLSYA